MLKLSVFEETAGTWQQQLGVNFWVHIFWIWSGLLPSSRGASAAVLLAIGPEVGSSNLPGSAMLLRNQRRCLLYVIPALTIAILLASARVRSVTLSSSVTTIKSAPIHPKPAWKSAQVEPLAPLGGEPDIAPMPVCSETEKQPQPPFAERIYDFRIHNRPPPHLQA
jgi:hypothetical protein